MKTAKKRGRPKKPEPKTQDTWITKVKNGLTIIQQKVVKK